MINYNGNLIKILTNQYFKLHINVFILSPFQNKHLLSIFKGRSIGSAVAMQRLIINSGVNK